MTVVLSVLRGPLLALPHTYEKHTHCTNPGTCQICDGGLALCTVCGGLEGALLDSCPGVRLTMEQHDWNYHVGFKYRMARDLKAHRNVR